MWQNPSENTMTANHPSNSREARAGALAALEALRKAESLVEVYHASSDGEETPQKALHGDVHHRQRIANTFIKAAGEMSPHAEGFIAALAEYVDFGFRVGEANLAIWKPESAMTAGEIKQGRAEILADMLAN